jgi:hypothetical protein
VGFRFGPHMGSAVPLMIQFADKAPEGDDELREQCLQVRRLACSRVAAAAG